MKKLIHIFLDQLRSKEIWKRSWELNRFHRFKNYQDWKKNSSKSLTIEDVPDIIVTTLLGIALLIILNVLLEGHKLKCALISCIVLIIAIKIG